GGGPEKPSDPANGGAAPAPGSFAAPASLSAPPPTGAPTPPRTPPTVRFTSQTHPARPALQQAAPQSMAFTLNAGQTTDQRVKLIAQGQNYTIFFSNNQTVLNLAHPTTTSPPSRPAPHAVTNDVVAISFAGANADARVVPQEELTQRSNYFAGSRKFTDVPNYGRVRIDNLYPGISVEYYGNAAGRLEHDFIVSPGADPSRIHMQYQGVQSATQDAAGNQILQTAGGRLTLQAPLLYQLDARGQRQAVSGGFQTFADHSVGFSVGAFDRSRPLVIDPILGYSTYLGGSG